MGIKQYLKTIFKNKEIDKEDNTLKGRINKIATNMCSVKETRYDVKLTYNNGQLHFASNCDYPIKTPYSKSVYTKYYYIGLGGTQFHITYEEDSLSNIKINNFQHSVTIDFNGEDFTISSNINETTPEELNQIILYFERASEWYKDNASRIIKEHDTKIEKDKLQKACNEQKELERMTKPFRDYFEVI